MRYAAAPGSFPPPYTEIQTQLHLSPVQLGLLSTPYRPSHAVTELFSLKHPSTKRRACIQTTATPPWGGKVSIQSMKPTSTEQPGQLLQWYGWTTAKGSRILPRMAEQDTHTHTQWAWSRHNQGQLYFSHKFSVLKNTSVKSVTGKGQDYRVYTTSIGYFSDFILCFFLVKLLLLLLKKNN